MLKKCKECGNELSSKVKKCPKCGIDQRNWFTKHKIISSFIILIILGVFGELVNNEDKSTQTTATNSSLQKKEQLDFKVGDVIKTDNFEITVTSIEEKSKVGSEYFQKSPSDGGTYVTVQWQYKNITDKPIGAFSFPNLSLLDRNEIKYTSDIEASGYFATEVEIDEKVLSDLNPDITVKGANVFEVSKDSFKQGGWKLLIDTDKDIKVSIN